MSWFDRHAEGDPAALYARLGAAVDASGLGTAIDTAAGAPGLRRFVLRAELRGGRARITRVDGPFLPRGGGPPGPAAWAAGQRAVEAALGQLWRLLPPPLRFDEFAIGVVRGADDVPALRFRFDEEADALRAADLPLPKGEPAPLEDPAYLRAAAAWAPRVDAVRARFRLAATAWSLKDGRLDDGERRVPAVALATWHPGQQRLSWTLAQPAGEEAPFVEPELVVDLGGAAELACFAAARLGALGVFQGTLDNGMFVFVGLKA